MAKAQSHYLCQSCGYQTARWMGRCPDCGEWASLLEERVTGERHGARRNEAPSGSSRATPITAVDSLALGRMSTGLTELDRVLGGGIVPGSFVLVSGDPGIGKSTLLLQASMQIALRDGVVLYVSGEESLQQTRSRASRLGPLSDRLLLLAETSLQIILDQADQIRPTILVIDSIQTIVSDELESPSGSLSQVREAAVRLMTLAKEKGISTVIIGHITKDGAIAGPKAMEHLVDAVVFIEGEGHQIHRLLRAVKNRFGPTPEIGVLEMTSSGLRELANPSEVFLSQRPSGAPGSVVIPTLEGSRPLLVELQALVAAPSAPVSRRVFNGVDSNRGILLLAILEKRLGLALSACDVYVNVVGGVRVGETAADLGIAAAVLSSARNLPLDPGLCVFGEVGLAGEVRAVPMAERRLDEAARLGLSHCLMSRHNLCRTMPDFSSLRVSGLSTVEELTERLERW
ncbi:DNA repair protein RadA [Candidatus Methylomirabilis lanthanidiphila]|uniref:DNA repair protein RadA n=1 Tax=Candidatus Methylomirabilis lanthanidiphila TaxID=2211376 RepID=A0A564ZIR1_9BACT|nr:DNA repair protein RadA [Candidatus Methylomirabilis lanthanidiphila]VUZ85205.1 DNA repair protein RadA [Candidatus Methylomirabilis lanthanidiphila]